MIKTARQLKDLIRNLSREKSADAQILMRNYMMERFLERISLSEYRDKFILKGGMLVAAIGAILWFISQLISHTELDEIAVLAAISDFAEGAAMGALFVGLIITSRYGNRIRAFKRRLLKRR